MTYSNHEIVPWDQLQGYEVSEYDQVDKVLGCYIRLDNGDTFECEHDVEHEVDAGALCVVFKQPYNEFRIAEMLNFFESAGLMGDATKHQDVVAKLKLTLASLKSGERRPFVSFMLLIGDNVYTVERK